MNQDVLLTAITVFILIGAFFVSIYGILELVEPGSFIDNLHPNQPAFWQQFVYSSFATLTTTGYGDVVPVSPWARAVANVEMVIGVLYIAILMPRLVGLYSQET